MKNTITTILLIAIVTISALAQNPPYKGGEVIKISDNLILECTDYGSNFIDLKIQSPVNIRYLHYASKDSITTMSRTEIALATTEDIGSVKNRIIPEKLLDIFCNILSPDQYKLFVENSALISFFTLKIYFNTSDGTPATVYINLVKDRPVFMELPPQVYGKFIEQIIRDIKLVDGKYKLTPYIDGSYNIQIKDVIRRYPELHK